MNILLKLKCFIFSLLITSLQPILNPESNNSFFFKVSKKCPLNCSFYKQKSTISPLKINKSIFEKKIQLQTEFQPIVYYLLTYLIRKNLTNHHASSKQKILQTKMLVTCQRFADMFLSGLVWQYSTNKNQYDKYRFKVLATYLQQ